MPTGDAFLSSPVGIKERFAALPEADRWRLMELLGPARSFSLILARA